MQQVKQMKTSGASSKMLRVLLLLAVVAGVFVGCALAGGNKGGEDIILYNGNIVLRGGGKGGKGKGNGGSIVVANSPQSMEMMPMFDWGSGFGRRR